VGILIGPVPSNNLAYKLALFNSFSSFECKKKGIENLSTKIFTAPT